MRRKKDWLNTHHLHMCELAVWKTLKGTICPLEKIVVVEYNEILFDGKIHIARKNGRRN